MIHQILTAAAAKGFLFKVVSEGDVLYAGGGIYAAREAIESVDECTLYLTDSFGDHRDWAYLVNGNEPHEIVCDCRSGGFFDDWG